MITYFDTQSHENVLRGLLHKGTNKIPVILVHGFFSSNKIGPYRLYFQLADYLNRRNFTVLRIDLSAMGESDGDDIKITFNTHTEDLCNAIESLLKVEGAKKAHIFAHCVGCCTALRCLERIKPLVASLTLAAPFIPTSDNYKILLGEKEYNQLLRKEPIYHKGMYCDRSFIEAGEVINDMDLIFLAKKKALKVFIPEKDQLSPLSNGIKWAQINSVDYEIIQNADHNFLNPNARRQLFFMTSNYIESLS